MAGKHFALLGEKLGHSLSVPIHRAILRLLGTQDSYRLESIPREGLAGKIPLLMEELDGFNITIPYKRDVMPFLDGMEPEAARVGAVNTAVRTQEGWIGYNTDVAGFAAMLRMHGLKAAGEDGVICVLGSFTILADARKAFTARLKKEADDGRT